METKTIVIVESPTKARTIARYLPAEWIVSASIGHVRDLPDGKSTIPKRYRQEPWAELGIDVEHDFMPLYVVLRGKSKIISQLRKQVGEVKQIIIATDEDREGESIAWHLTQILKPKVPVHRIVFHEITESAIREALKHFRDIDMHLVRAQETRRILDRLYGYTLSPLIWKKIAYGLSAGRVQSPGLRMIVNRERERIRFQSTTYWDVVARLLPMGAATPIEGSDTAFEARLTELDGKQVVRSKDFDATTGLLLKRFEGILLTERQARALADELLTAEWRVETVDERSFTVNPAAPLITSTLQQEGNRKLRLPARETMRIAQRLYERGLITYMRTDSPHLSGQAIGVARATIEERFGADYLSKSPRQYRARSKQAQEAHEAIRPAGSRFADPDSVDLAGKDRQLYDLIWRHTLATQMKSARKLTISVGIEAGRCRFGATGTRVVSPGFLILYPKQDDRESHLPPLEPGNELRPVKIEPVGHSTKPPARYTDASLVQNLDRLDIGRPSTYATIIGTLLERNYVERRGNSLTPTYTGIAVVQLLERHFAGLIDYAFSSEMEDALDEIAYGKKDHLGYLRRFYLGEEGLRAMVESRADSITIETSRTVELPHLETNATIRIGQFGAYLIWRDGDNEPIHASLPAEIAPGDLGTEDIEALIRQHRDGPKAIGADPETGEDIYCLTGRYGPYVQRGLATKESKPKRANIPRALRKQEITVELALKLLSLPRQLGRHPVSNKEIVANVGPYGAFVVHDANYRTLGKDDDIYTIDLKRALELLAREKKGRKQAAALREIGVDPTTKETIAIYDGRYGPYIKVSKKNISLPPSMHDRKSIEALTLEQALKIIKSRTKR